MLLLAAVLWLSAPAFAADTARRLELQLFNDSGLPLILGEVRTNGIWAPDAHAEPKMPLPTVRTVSFVLAPRRPGQGATATIMVEGPSKAFAQIDLSLPSMGVASVKARAGGGLYAAPAKELSRDGSRWVFSLSLASVRHDIRAKKREPSWRDDLSAEAVKDVDAALQRGATKARTCFTVFESRYSEPVRLVLSVDGGKGRVVSAEVLEPYDQDGVKNCLARAFIGELVLPFEGKRSVPVSFERPGASRQPID